VTDDQQYLYTGGSDKKLISYSFVQKKVVKEIKFDEKISSLRQNSKHPEILLVSLTAKQNQLRLFDCRLNSSILQLSYQFTNPDQSASQYIIPSWSCSGNLIISGSVDAKIYVWDVRYNKASDPLKSWPIHKKRVLRSEFHPSREQSFLTLSSDRQLGSHILMDLAL